MWPAIKRCVGEMWSDTGLRAEFVDCLAAQAALQAGSIAEADIETALKTQLVVSTVLMTPLLYYLAQSFLPPAFYVSGACASPSEQKAQRAARGVRGGEHVQRRDDALHVPAGKAPSRLREGSRQHRGDASMYEPSA